MRLRVRALHVVKISSHGAYQDNSLKKGVNNFVRENIGKSSLSPSN